MINKLSFHGTVKNGKFETENQDQLYEYIRSFKGQRTTLTFGKFRKPRSLKENKYYWKVIIPILADELGYSTSEMHEALKFHFLLDKSGKLPFVRSTASLSTVEFETYLSQIRIWSSTEMGINIPDPNNFEKLC